ncbi:TRAF3-interacting protein 1 isoform X1 [Petromyzon marinus]|uniref:TRAF3-interacting protein 1 isoform X1 n=2 Tax=Petromyzon marinus TaxID=7757 RepID=UPI003F6EFE3D
MDVSAMKRTQETLGRVIRKPPLTEKLLGKPPFRFLHDVITEVIRTTGFMKGLYGESDMKSDNVKEREAKITFLQKAIDVVAMASGEAVPVRPSKIVAGHEPERTNEFLQALAQCCLSKLPSEDAVRRVLAGEKPDAKSVAAPAKTQGKENRDERPSRQRETKKEVEFKEPSGSRERQEKEASSQDRHHRDRDRDKSKDGDKDRGRDRDREREKERHAARDGERDRERTKDGHRDRDSERRREKETNAEGSKERVGDGARDRERGGERRERGGERKDREERGDHRVAAGSSKDKDRRRDKQRDEEKKDVKSRDREPPTAATLEDARGLEPASEPAEAVDFETGSPARVVRPPTAKGHRRRHRDVVTNDAAAAADEEAEGAQKEEEKEEGAPVNGEAADAAALPLQRRPPRPSSARPAAPRIRRQESAETHPTERTGSAKAVANVIVEGGRNSDGDDGGDDDEQFVVAESTPAPSDSLDAGPLEATEDNDGEEHGGLVKKILETKKGYGATRTPPKVVLDGARQKGREAAVRETERLRGAVQALCRSTLPLSKVMDYLQEDLDAMHAELATWTRQRRQHAEALADQHRLTEKALEPLRAELTTLDQQIQEQLEQIGAVKASVHRNDEKIDKMIGSIGAGARA